VSIGATCVLKADGVKVADGSPGDPTTDPTALSGLSISWGRSTTVDQPDVSTLTVDLLDEPGGKGFRDVFKVGTPLTVEATAITYPSPTVSSFPDPGFESAAPHALTIGGTTVRSTRRKDAGTYSAFITTDWLARGGPRADASAIFAPLPFVPTGTSPGAWDTIPRTATGQKWHVGVRVWVPSGTAADVYAVYFSAPWAGSYVIGPKIGTQYDTGGGFATVGADLTPPPGVWVAVMVRASAYFYLSWNGAAITWDASPYVWDELGALYVDTISVLAPAAGTPQTVLVWSGRVTNQEAFEPEGSLWPRLRITAADFMADLANCDVGDVPWAAESMSARFNRIVTASGMTLPVTIDSTVASITVSWRDVDSQGAAGLLQEVASSVDAIVWAATHSVSGPYLDVEDPGTRPPDQVLKLVGGVIQIVSSLTSAQPISACDLAQDPVRWRQDVGDVVTRAAIGWLEQITGPPISTAEHTHTTIDTAREALYGKRRYGVTTQLTTDADATNVAQRILNRTQLGWRADGFTIDDSWQQDVTPAVLLKLLDGTSRNGLYLKLTDLPAWSPVGAELGVYLEGGSYRFDDGWWVLDLTVSNARSAGQSAYWDQPPVAWQWNMFDPSVTWDAVTGVGVSP